MYVRYLVYRYDWMSVCKSLISIALSKSTTPDRLGSTTLGFLCLSVVIWIISRKSSLWGPVRGWLAFLPELGDRGVIEWPGRELKELAPLSAERSVVFEF